MHGQRIGYVRAYFGECDRSFRRIVTAMMLAVLRRGLSLRFWSVCQIFIGLLDGRFLSPLQCALCGLFAATRRPD